LHAKHCRREMDFEQPLSIQKYEISQEIKRLGEICRALQKAIQCSPLGVSSLRVRPVSSANSANVNCFAVPREASNTNLRHLGAKSFLRTIRHPPPPVGARNISVCVCIEPTQPDCSALPPSDARIIRVFCLSHACTHTD
jgi:hypothetical protein